MENDPQTRDERARCQALDRAVGNAARNGSSGDPDQIVKDARLFHGFLMGLPQSSGPLAPKIASAETTRSPTTLSAQRRMGHPHPDDRD